MTIMETNYRRAGGKGPSGEGNGGGVTKLTNYLDKADGLRNQQGEQMSEEETNEFVREAKQNEFQRMIVFSPPEHADLSNKEFSLRARQTMDEYLKTRPEASYCFAIHRDTDTPHVQAAVTGSKDSLAMYDDEIEELQELTSQTFAQSIEEKEEQTETETETAAESESASLSQSIGRRAD